MPLTEALNRARDFINTHTTFTLITHTDADGICAVALMQGILEQLNKQATTVFLDQISTSALQNLSKEIATPCIFLDLGSSHLEQLDTLFTTPTLIIDHHKVQGTTKHTLLNPANEEQDGTSYCCAASLTWKLSQVLNVPQNESIALIGAQADHQEPFIGINAEVVESAERKNLISREEGARLYGIMAKPLVPLIAYSYDLKIPGITKNPRGARELLDELHIDQNQMYLQLSHKERNTLSKALIARSPNPHARITHTFLTSYSGQLQDTREAATLLNACGRLNRAQLAVDLLRGAEIEQAKDVHNEYKQHVRVAHEWAKQQEWDTSNGLLIFEAQEEILPSVAGTLCSILVRGGEVDQDVVVVCLARYRDGSHTTKVSARTEGSCDVATLLAQAAKSVGGEGGGHTVAAGAVIPSDQESTFLDALRSTFE